MAKAPRDIVDMVTRDLARQAPLGFFGLAGLPEPTSGVRFEDISVIMPELQADKVMIVDGPPAYALYPEFQTNPPDQETMQNWVIKLVILMRHLQLPVSLIIFYLHRGDRARFPESLAMGIPLLQTRVHFPAVRVWEKEGEIRQNYPELAQLLLVTAVEPVEDTLREVKELIDGLEGSAEKRDNLCGLAAMLGMHYFEESLVRAVFGPKFEEIKRMGAIDRWLDEKYQEGISQGIDQGARQSVLVLLADKFGQVPAEVAERVNASDAAWCQHLNVLAARARSLEELDLR